MALMGWWPLTGNTNDHSGNGFNGSAVGSLPVDNGGKIGQTYLFQNNDNGVNINENFTGWTEYTMCAWINPAGNHRNYNGTVMSSGNWNGSCWAFGVSQDNSSIDVAGPGYNKYISYSVPLNKWTHIMCIVKNSISKLYVNGAYVGERSVNAALASDASNMCIGRETYASGHFSFNGRINDVRIYNHCLSTKEIKEMLKLKVLHYNFNTPCEAFNNLAKNSTYVVYNNDSQPASLSDTGRTYRGCKIFRLTFRVTNADRLSYHQTTLAGHGIYGFYRTFSANTKYAFGIYWKAITHSDTRVGGTASNMGGWREIPSKKMEGGWNLVGQQQTVGSAAKTDNIFTSFACPSLKLNEDIIIDFTCPILVEGRDYIPLNHDYQNGENGRIEDASGYGNHGISSQTWAPKWVDESQLGSGSMHFTGQKIGTQYPYLVSSNSLRIPEEGTISYFIKHYTDANGDNKYAVGYGLYGFSTMNNPNIMGLIYYYEGANYTTKTVAANLRDGQWHQYTISWSTIQNKLKIYKDGVKISEQAPGTMYHVGHYKQAVIGSSWTYDYGGISASIDDVRFYCSMLSDEDVAAIYSTKASIDRNGKLYCNEIVENTDSLIDVNSVSASNLLATGISFGAMNSRGRRLLTSSGAGTFRFLLPTGLLVNGREYTFSFKYTHLVGNTLSISDFCDVGGDIMVSNGTMSITSSKSSYDNTFRFVDCNIGANAQIEIYDMKLYEGKPRISSVNKKGQFVCNEINECDSISFPTKTEHGVNWVRLYYHNSRDGTVLWGDHNEFLRCLDPYKMSNLWALEQFRGKDGKFEFLMQCSGASGYNRWKQSNNFTDAGPATGYEAISCSWTNNGWYGLEGNPNNGNSHADGCATSTWWYAIGPRVKYGLGMPCPNIETGGTCEIWVRCEDPGVFKMNKDGTARATEFIEI